MACKTSFASYNDSIVPRLTGSPRVNAHEHKIVSKLFRVMIIEGLKYVRMKCRERGHFINLTKMRPDIKTCP